MNGETCLKLKFRIIVLFFKFLVQASAVFILYNLTLKLFEAFEAFKLRI